MVTAARAPHRGDVYLVCLDPTLGSEIRKTRPCLIVSPDELNLHLRTAVVAPMTTGGQEYPWRVPCRFQQRAGFVALDQLRRSIGNVSSSGSDGSRPQPSRPCSKDCRRCSRHDDR